MKKKIKFVEGSFGRATQCKYCSYYGLSKDDLGKKITLDGDEYVITGMKPSRRKFPIVIQSLNSDKSMLATIDSVRKALGK